MSLSKEQVDHIAAVYESLTESIKALQSQRSALVEDLPFGRTDGTVMGFSRARNKTVTTMDVMKLRRYVKSDILEMCRVRRTYKGHTKLVKALKPKKVKTKGATHES